MARGRKPPAPPPARPQRSEDGWAASGGAVAAAMADIDAWADAVRAVVADLPEHQRDQAMRFAAGCLLGRFAF